MFKRKVNSKVSYLVSDMTKCPCCSEEFQREELLTGGGRLNAGGLTDELHRLYITTDKYGPVYPILYSILTCPNCYYTAFKDDFNKPKNEALEIIRSKASRTERTVAVEQIFDDVNFRSYRRLNDGIASYIAGIYSYEYFPANLAPLIKQGICALRAAWLAVHLHYEFKDDGYDYLARILYRKAAYFYNHGIAIHDTTEQPLSASAILNFGPDVDHNFGLDGAIYLASLLQYKYGQRSDQDLRIKRLDDAKIMIARLVGTGKVSQNKPAAILNPGRDLYSIISREVKVLRA